jgi:hypothetical protein
MRPQATAEREHEKPVEANEAGGSSGQISHTRRSRMRTGVGPVRSATIGGRPARIVNL